jgi:hypothetical protein
MTDTVEVCCSVFIAADFLRFKVGGISIHCCVLSILYKYLVTIRAICYY